MIRSPLKTLVSIAAVSLAGAAFAQGTPPNPNVSNPALGAGQQTQQGTPMGTTGVPAANTAPNTGTMPMAAPNAMPSRPAAMAPEAAPPMRTARADRN